MAGPLHILERSSPATQLAAEVTGALKHPYITALYKPYSIYEAPVNLFSPLLCVCVSLGQRNGLENFACSCKKCNRLLERERVKKQGSFCFAAAEILSPRWRALSSITNLSPGLDGHRGAVLALLVLSVSLFLSILHHTNKPEWESSWEGERKRKDDGGKRDNREAGWKNREGGKGRKEGNGSLKTRVILCVFMVDREKEGGKRATRRPWRGEYAHIAAANWAHSHSRVMETF